MEKIVIANATIGVLYVVNFFPNAIKAKKYFMASSLTCAQFFIYLALGMESNGVFDAIKNGFFYTLMNFSGGMVVWYFFHRAGRDL